MYTKYTGCSFCLEETVVLPGKEMTGLSQIESVVQNLSGHIKYVWVYLLPSIHSSFLHPIPFKQPHHLHVIAAQYSQMWVHLIYEL